VIINGKKYKMKEKDLEATLVYLLGTITVFLYILLCKV